MTINPFLFGILLGFALYGAITVYRRARDRIKGMLP